MALDPSIILQAQAPKFDDPLTVRAKQAQLSDLMAQGQVRQMQLQQAQQAQQQEQTLADLYRQHGTDAAGLVQGMAQSGLGGRIPGFQKQQAELGKVQNEGEAAKYKLLKTQLDDTNAGLSSLLSDPQLSTDKVVSFLSQRAAAMPDQAQRLAQEAAQLPGDPGRLRAVLTQKALEGLDASKRIDLILGKTEMQDQGGARQVFNTNQLTGQVTSGASFGKTATPGEVMTDQRNRSEGALNRGVQMRGQDIGKVPAGYRANADGTLSVIPGGPADPNAAGGKAMTEDQGKATGWLIQATNAWNNMQKAIGDSKGADVPGFGDAVAKIPGMQAVGKAFTGADRQKFNQAASSLSEALLRAATGAGVNKDEAAQKIAEITPQFGDDEATRKQKQDAIPLYLESLKVRAGPGAAKASAIVKPTGSAPSAGAVEDGYVFLGGNPADPSRWKKK